MSRLAVLILTYNEERNIKACIESVSFADEIIVIDSGSQDQTISISEAMGAKTVYHNMTEGFAGQRNFALTQTEANWVLFLDADERITCELAAEIQATIALPEQFAYEILRYNIAFGQPVRHGGHKPDLSLRLYPRRAISWRGVVHEQAVVSLPVKQLKHGMLHHTYTTWDRYFFKLNQYTTMMAQKKNEGSKKSGFFQILLRPPFAFFRDYILKGGFLDGKMGLVLAGLHGFYTFIKYVKLYYLQHEEGAKE